MSLSGAPGDQSAPPSPFPGLHPSSPGWISGVGVEGVLFCSDPHLCPEMESEKKARGVLVRASLCLPSSASSEDRGSGGVTGGGGAADGGAGLGRWLTLRVAAGLLGADGRGEGRLFPSHHSFHLLLPSALRICMSLLVSRSLEALAPPPVPGPRLPLPPVRQFRECPAPPPQLLSGESVSDPRAPLPPLASENTKPMGDPPSESPVRSETCFPVGKTAKYIQIHGSHQHRTRLPATPGPVPARRSL